MRFSYDNGFFQLEAAIRKADELLEVGSPMLREILNKRDWKYDVPDSAMVVLNLTTGFEKPVPVEVYRPAYRYSKQVGAWNGKRIGISEYALQWVSTTQLIGILLHEYSHAKKYHHTAPGWLGRRLANYKTEDKVNHSVPYFLSENVRRWI